MAGGGDDKYNLNLVPFIDLFSTLIIFLLSTAVWEQLAAVPVNLGNSDQQKVSMPNSKEEAKLVKSDLKVFIKKDSIELFDQGKSTTLTREQLISSQYEGVLQFADEARLKYPTKNDVVIQADDDATYEDIVAVMDKFLARNFDQLVVMGSEM
ncbi:MAG: biopolymer transporter ExbD [Bdellovibrionota bacterium]